MFVNEYVVLTHSIMDLHDIVKYLHQLFPKYNLLRVVNCVFGKINSHDKVSGVTHFQFEDKKKW